MNRTQQKNFRNTTKKTDKYGYFEILKIEYITLNTMGN